MTVDEAVLQLWRNALNDVELIEKMVRAQRDRLKAGDGPDRGISEVVELLARRLVALSE